MSSSLTDQRDDRLTLAETRALIARAQEGDLAAQEKLTEANLRLVAAIARRYVDRGASFDDLFQSGCIGLLKAVRGFDLNQSVAFSTYAVPHILGEIRRFLREDRPIKVARDLLLLSQKVVSAREELSQSLGRSPTPDEVAAKIGISKEQVVEALDAVTPVMSLHEPIAGESEAELTLAHMIPASTSQITPAERMALHQIILQLPIQDRQLVILRFMMRLSQVDIARRLGCSQAHVSRMEVKVKQRLRQMWEA